MDEALGAVIEVIRVLKRLGIDYLIGGSLASSFHGIPRSTQDADLVADLRDVHISALSEALRGRFYFDEEGMREAVRRRSSFNLIHLETMFKVDIFVLKDDPFSKQEMRRREQAVLDQASGESLDVASAEDTVLQKLAWYRLGGGVSDRQWKDLLSVLKVRRHELDLDYLARWSEHLGVAELLQKALQEAGIDESGKDSSK